MTTFKEAQRVQSLKAARSKRFNRVPTEDQEQMTLMSWAHRVKYGSGRLSDYLFHIPVQKYLRKLYSQASTSQ